MSSASAAKIKGLVEALIPPLLMPFCKKIVRMTPYARGRLVEGPKTYDSSDPQILETAWKHVSEMTKLPRNDFIPATPRWEYFLQRTREEMCFFSSPTQALHYAQTRINFEHREPIIFSRHLFDLHAATLKSEFREHGYLLDRLGDSPMSRPDTLLNCGNHLVSNIYFWHLRTLLQAITHVKDLGFVGEIGGGYGALARYFLNAPETKMQTYCIIDFPESLFFSEVFLRASFPDIPMLYVSSETPLTPEEFGKYKLVLCPLRNLNAISEIPFNIVVNTGSMQEMTEEWIDFWMKWLTRQPCRWFYSMNYFGQPLDFMAEGGNTWSPRLPKEWVTRIQTYDPSFIRQQSDRNYAEILAEKPGASSTLLPSSVSRYDGLKHRKMTNEVLLEAMDIVRSDYEPGIMWDILQRISRDMTFMPKEAYFLADYLKRNSVAKLGTENANAVDSMFQRLTAIRKGGAESAHTI